MFFTANAWCKFKNKKMIALYKSMSATSYRFSLWNVQSDCTLSVVPEKPFKPLEFEFERGFLVW